MVSPDWEMIGTALDLKPYQIKNSEGDNNVKSLRKVLLVWLSGGCATVSTLTQALRSELVGHGRVAQEIEKKFTSILESQSIPGSSRPDESKLEFTITHQSPRKVEVEDGKSILLLVQSSQKQNVSHQWNKDKQPLADSQWFSGIHDDILTINHAHQGTGGEYTCCVRSQEREIVSNKVTLTVLHPVAKKTLLDLYSVNTLVLQDEEWPPVGNDEYARKSPGYHLHELVFHEDTATVESLVAAVRLHRRDADVHLDMRIQEKDEDIYKI